MLLLALGLSIMLGLSVMLALDLGMMSASSIVYARSISLK